MSDVPQIRSDNLLTFMLEGEVELGSFARALAAFNKLIAQLSIEAGGEIDWTLDDLVYSSAVTVIRGNSKEPERVERVVKDYVSIGRALQRNQPIQRSSAIVRPARMIGRMVGHAKGVKAVRFETAHEEAIISQPPKRIQQPKSGLVFVSGKLALVDAALDEPQGAYGAIEGVVQTLTNRYGLRFTLYDSLHDRAVSFYLQPGQEEMMRDNWGKRCVVEGWVTRDPNDGHPIAIRRVTKVTPIEEGDYRQARGALPMRQGGLLPEQVIRQLRDD
jgi:hypothetical protein